MTSRRHERYELAASTVIMLLGLAIFLRPLFQYSGGRAPGDYGDGRFIHYLLEHSWRWISRGA